MNPTPLPCLPLLMSGIVLLSVNLSQAMAQGTVVNPEQIAMPLNVSQTRAVEPDGSGVVNFQVQFAFDNQELANTWSGQRPLTVGFTTENGSARAGTCGTAGADYVAQSGHVQFTGQLSLSATLQVCGDDLSEGDEQFGLRLTSTENHANFFISFRPGRVPQLMTITDDEPLPTLSVTPTIQVTEPSSGTASAVFTVSLTGPINERPVTVNFATAPNTAAAGSSCPRSTENVDYLTRSGTLTFSPPGDLLQSPQIPRTQRITVPVCSDSQRFEVAETFFVKLTGPVNAILSSSAPSITVSPRITEIRGTATIN